MVQHIERLKVLLSRQREKREQRKSRRMATRLALFLAAVIALPFAYWQFELYEVSAPVDTTAELAAKCDNLAATLEKVQRGAGRQIGANNEALNDRISECDEMGIDITTGSIDPNAGEAVE